MGRLVPEVGDGREALLPSLTGRGKKKNDVSLVRGAGG